MRGPFRTWMIAVLAAPALLIVVVGGIWMFTGPLHPDPGKVPTVAAFAPPPRLAGAVRHARQIVLAHLVGENLPGLSVAVGTGGELVWAEGFGFADLRTGAPVTPNHRFRIGTASVAVTSAAAGLLIENDRLKLDDEIQKYVPAFPRKQGPVTLRELMGHTAGLVPGDGDEGPLYAQHCERPAEALPHFAGSPLLFEPGSGYRYSSYGWVLVSAAIEAAAERPLPAFLKERIFGPLGMLGTSAEARPAEDGDDFPLFNLVREILFDPRTARSGAAAVPSGEGGPHVTSYFPRFAADPSYGLHLMRPLDYSCYSGAAAYLSTPSDLVRFAAGVGGGKLLRPETVELLQTPGRLPSGEPTGYGLGWDVQTVRLGDRSTRAIGHGGHSLGGDVASLMTFPEFGIVVAVTSNISYAGTSSLAVKIAEEFVEPAGVERK